VIGAIQAQEVVKLLHGLPALLGRGFVFEGATHSSYGVTYPVNPECPWHEEVAPDNVKSPLNAKAAAWAEKNVARLPLQTGDHSRPVRHAARGTPAFRGRAVLKEVAPA
jgi:hypothetical protein